METILAPQVLKPPCARNRAWMKSARAPRTVLINGPTRIAPNGVPQGWEQLPVTGTGTGKTEIRKITAPAIPRRGTKPLTSLVFLLIMIMPITTKIAAITYHTAAHFAGNIPSAMCIACAGFGQRNSNTRKAARAKPI